MVGTWAGHGVVCVGLQVAGAVPAAFFDMGAVGALAGASAGLTFYLHREQRDKLLKVREGKYDERARMDRVGDLVAAAFVYVAALVTNVAGMF